MNRAAAVMLAGFGAIGLYAIGSAAVEHKRAIAAGELPTHLPEDYESSATEDVVAFAAAMAMLGIAFDQAPALAQQSVALFR